MLKNQALGVQVLEMLETLIEAGEALLLFTQNDNTENRNILEADMKFMLESILGVSDELIADEPSLNIDLACESCLYSLNNTIKMNIKNAVQKIEFELIPLLKDMHLQFYFFGIVFPDKEKMANYYKNEMPKLALNKYVEKSEENGSYKYDVSVIILGYNNINYTKMCVYNFLKYVPKDLNYELILLNHGSNDGTKEFFKSMLPNKQMDVLKNGGGISAYNYISEGKYILFISNDVLVTKNAISNMLKCITSDEKIICVVPSTPHVSNYQNLASNYNDLNEMFDFAASNNVSNPYRWEQRVRLCDPISLTKSSAHTSSKGLFWWAYFIGADYFLFPDDKLAYLATCNNYKLMLANDSYCYHYGSITISKEMEQRRLENQEDYYLKGSDVFKEFFGVAPFSTGYCYSKSLFSLLKCSNKEPVNILGVCSGLGSNPLKVQQNIKENAHNLNATLYNITDDKTYIANLTGLSYYFEYITDYTLFPEAFLGTEFDYIIIEKDFTKEPSAENCIHGLYKRLAKKGIIVVYLSDSTIINELKKQYKNVQQNKNWLVWSKI